MDASGKTITNEVFSGVAYPDKLESFLHGMVSVQYMSLSKVKVKFSAEGESSIPGGNRLQESRNHALQKYQEHIATYNGGIKDDDTMWSQQTV